jgi:hypothetical protein
MIKSKSKLEKCQLLKNAERKIFAIIGNLTEHIINFIKYNVI